MRFLLLDRITALDPPHSAQALKCISLADDLFVDHFPGYPVMPGTMLIEAMAQLGGVVLEASLKSAARPYELHALLTLVDRAKLRRGVRPGDRLVIDAKVLRVSEDAGRVRAQVRATEPLMASAEPPAFERAALTEGDAPAVEGAPLVAEAELTFVFAQVTNARLIAKRKEILDVWLHGSVRAP